MPIVHRQPVNQPNTIQLRPAKPGLQRVEIHSTARFHHEQSLAAVVEHSRPPNARLPMRGALDLERVQYSPAVLDARAATTNQPETPTLVQVTGVASSMPARPINTKLRLGIAQSIQVAGLNMR